MKKGEEKAIRDFLKKEMQIPGIVKEKMYQAFEKMQSELPGEKEVAEEEDKWIETMYQDEREDEYPGERGRRRRWKGKAILVAAAVAVLCLSLVVIGREGLWSALEGMYSREDEEVSTISEEAGTAQTSEEGTLYEHYLLREDGIVEYDQDYSVGSVTIMLYQAIASDTHAVVDFKLTGLRDGELLGLRFDRMECQVKGLDESILYRGKYYNWNMFRESGKGAGFFQDPDGNADYLLDISLNKEDATLNGAEMAVTFHNLIVSYQTETGGGYEVYEGNWSFSWKMKKSVDAIWYTPNVLLEDIGFELKRVELDPISIRCRFADSLWREDQPESQSLENNRLYTGTIDQWVSFYGVRMKGGEITCRVEDGAVRGMMSWFQEETGEESLILTLNEFLDGEEVEALIFKDKEGKLVELKLEKKK